MSLGLGCEMLGVGVWGGLGIRVWDCYFDDVSLRSRTFKNVRLWSGDFMLEYGVKRG